MLLLLRLIASGQKEIEEGKTISQDDVFKEIEEDLLLNSSRKYSVFWIEAAKLDLAEIVNYIKAENPKAAISIYKKIKAKCLRLETFPLRNRLQRELHELGMKNYRELIVSPYRIIYEIREKNVFILAVIDGRRSLEDFLFKRLLR